MSHMPKDIDKFDDTISIYVDDQKSIDVTEPGDKASIWYIIIQIE